MSESSKVSAPRSTRTPERPSKAVARTAAGPIPNRSMGRLLGGAAGEMPGADHARRAVAGAAPGRFPFADRIARETGGRVDARSIPTAVVPGLPSRGVAFGGRIALRPDAGIAVARHELSHVLGADERTARRAERDGSVLAGLTRRAPRDGWDRDPKFNYLRLYIEDLYVDVEYDPKQASDGKYREAVLEEAEKQVRTILSEVESSSVDWKDFATNVDGWIERGFDGMFPLFDAFAGKDDGTLEVDKAHGGGSVGQENEIRSAIIQGTSIKYDMTLARTKAVASRVKVDEKGEVAEVPSPWPLLRVSADQVTKAPVKEKKPEEKTGPMIGGPKPGLRKAMTFSPGMFQKELLKKKKRKKRKKSPSPEKKVAPPKRLKDEEMKQGVIELIFGPVDSSDDDAARRRATATSLFIETLVASWGKGGLPFQSFAGVYNSAIESAASNDKSMADYKIGEAVSDVVIGCMTVDPEAQKGPPPQRSEIVQSIQTSVEVSSVKLGDMKDESFLALWDEKNENEAVDKKTFEKAREVANAYVAEHLRPRLAALSGGVYDEKSINVDRLNGLFTLGLFQLGKASHSLRKGASPVMEKAGFGDQMREMLDARDKAALWDLVKPGPKEVGLLGKAFQASILEAARKVSDAKDQASGSKARRFDPKHKNVLMRLMYFAPGGMANRYGPTFGRREDDAKYFQPRSKEKDMKWDFRGRQRVFAKDDSSKGGTTAGKPIPMTYRMYHGRGLLHRDPRFVVEVRGAYNRINTTHGQLYTGQDVSKQIPEVLKVLDGASESPKTLRLGPGPSEKAKPLKHTLSYPDEQQKLPERKAPPIAPPVLESRDVGPAPLPTGVPGPVAPPPLGLAPPPLQTGVVAPVPAPPPLVQHEPHLPRPPERFNALARAAFVVRTALDDLELPTPLKAGPERRQLELAFRKRVVAGRYGPISLLARGSGSYERLSKDLGKIVWILHARKREESPKLTRSVSSRYKY